MFETELDPTRTAVIVPIMTASATKSTALHADIVANGEYDRPPDAQLEEAIGLCKAIHLITVWADLCSVKQIKPATLIGGGKVDDYANRIKESDIDLVIVDHALTPVQQRNLEEKWKVKVLDRTGLILEIFGARAQTKEGRLQVDLAALSFQKGRLVRSWTHLERQRGGAGFLGGPGETQIESDRRELQMKIDRLRKQLDQVRKTRSLHRKQRTKNETPVIALVGYTNAGKSTLFNQVTGANILAKDLLFATLDPTLRSIELTDRQTVLFSDTVGFISNLPTDLVASFRATLEEVIQADIILHVHDASHPHMQAQTRDVDEILADLGIEETDKEGELSTDRHIVHVYNKSDLLSVEEKDVLEQRLEGNENAYIVSAVQRQGVNELMTRIEELVFADKTTIDVILELKAMKHLHWYYQNGDILKREDKEDGTVELSVRLDKKDITNHPVFQVS